jgi:hypothetical protein
MESESLSTEHVDQLFNSQMAGPAPLPWRTPCRGVSIQPYDVLEVPYAVFT